jgi:hypothetical protein
MAKLRFFEGMKVLPLLAPVDILSDNPTATKYLDLDNAHWATLAVSFGAITCDTCTVILQASSAATSNASELEIGFQYRLSTAVDTDDTDAGSITTATSTGVAVAETEDGKVLFVEVDPAAVMAAGGSTSEYRWVRLTLDPGDATTVLAGVVAYVETRYPTNGTISST